MAHYALLCTIDQSKLSLFVRLRAQHYAFLIEQRKRILFGGPARQFEGGPPQTMIIIVEAATLDDAKAFIAAEPYNANGGFSDVDVRSWSQVLPESYQGELARTYETELLKSSRS